MNSWETRCNKKTGEIDIEDARDCSKLPRCILHSSPRAGHKYSHDCKDVPVVICFIHFFLKTNRLVLQSVF